jgi:toxin ParE1/3/4
MPRIQRTEQAELELVEILFYFRSRSPNVADRFESDFEEKCRLLAEFPHMGRDRVELAPDLRSSLVKPYVLFYRPLDDVNAIIRVIHGSRDLSGLFE